MKYLFITLALVLSKQIYAQVKTVSYKVIPLVEDRRYELDGGLIVLNTSRVVIPVSLPENTIEWYYMFTSYSNEDVLDKRTTEINLASQLTRALDETGLTSGLVSMLFTPNGSSSSNIYVFGDRYNANNFVNKTDQYLIPEYWSYYSQASIKSATQGKQLVKFPPNEQFYIGIQAGPSPVVVEMEIVAIVDESVTDYNIWSESTINEVKQIMRQAFVSEDNLTENQALDLSTCITDSLVANYSVDEFFEFSEDLKTSILEQYAEKCYQKIDGFVNTKEYKTATTYGNLGWQYFENGDLEKAIEYSMKALELHPNLGYVNANLGLFNFIKGYHDKANEFYIEAIMNFKDEKLSGKEYLRAAIEDLNTAKKNYKEMTGYEAILKELQREFDNW